MARKRGLTSIPTPTHIVPERPRLVRAALPDPEGHSYKRELWVPEEIDAILAGRTPPNVSVDPRFFDPMIGSLMQRFVAGMYVTGALRGDPKKLRPDFERLVGIEEVWAMCFREPKFNQWRLMGRFIAFNTFVGLGLYRRQFLNGEKKYHTQAERFLEHWNTIYSRSSIFSGEKIEHYISLPVKDLYAPIF